jgi:hypothetical protein
MPIDEQVGEGGERVVDGEVAPLERVPTALAGGQGEVRGVRFCTAAEVGNVAT